MYLTPGPGRWYLQLEDLLSAETESEGPHALCKSFPFMQWPDEIRASCRLNNIDGTIESFVIFPAEIDGYLQRRSLNLGDSQDHFVARRLLQEWYWIIREKLLSLDH